MKLTAPQATIIAALIAVLGIVVGSFLNPFAEKLVNRPTPEPGSTAMAIEQIPQQIFAYAGNNNPDGGWGAFWLIYDEENVPNYKLEYSLPGGQYSYAGLAFLFTDGTNLSAYHAVESVVIFGGLNDVVDLYFKDIAGNFDTIRVANNGANEMVLRHEFTNFPDINFNAVKEFGIVASTDFTTGDHQVRIKNVRFAK